MLELDGATKRFGGRVALNAVLVVLGGRIYTRAILHPGSMLTLD